MTRDIWSSSWAGWVGQAFLQVEFNTEERFRLVTESQGREEKWQKQDLRVSRASDTDTFKP